MSPNANTSENTPLRHVFPATRFVPDIDPVTKNPLFDDNGEYKSGTLVVTIFEAVKVANAAPAMRTVATVSKPMSLSKFRLIRDDIDHLSVQGLKDYFPELNGELTPKVEPTGAEADVEKLEKKVDDLTEKLAQALELLSKKQPEPVTPEDMDESTDDEPKEDPKPVEKPKKTAKK